MRIAVIGAGASGLVAARYLKDDGLAPVVFEQAAAIGGVWSPDDARDGDGPAYHSLRTNTSRQVTAFSDFPFPSTLPDFPGRTDVLSYLERYAARFDLHESIRLRHRVLRAQRTADGGWLVAARSPQGERTEVFDALVVCSGIHWDPVTPPYPGLEGFTGRRLHSMQYNDPQPFEGQEVLVVGVGSSGADVASEVADSARSVLLSAREGVWLVPRSIGGRPFDHGNTRLVRALPAHLRPALFRRRLLREYGRRGWTGARHVWGQQESDPGRRTISDHLLPHILSGAVRVRPAITRFDGPEVLFADGSRARPDAVIFCTGYARRFPFLDGIVAVAPDFSMDLYKHVFPPAVPRLAFAGMVRVQGSVFPIVELQARWIARVFAGRAHLPSPDRMLNDIEARHRRQARAGMAYMRVPFLDYADEIAEQIGARPRVWRHPRLLVPFLTGPPTAAQFRSGGET